MLDQLLPVVYMIGVLLLVLPAFLQSNSKLKELLSNLSIWVIIVLIVTTIVYFLLKWKKSFIGLCGITSNKLATKEIKQGKRKCEQRKRK